MNDAPADNAVEAAPAVRIAGVGKCYAIYRQPSDRLKQMIFRRRRFYEEYWALRDVSFEVARGETVGILGRNGAGKSTLLQIVTGTVEPTTGMVEVNGRLAALLELGAGFNPEFTGRENVYLAASLLGLDRATIDQRFDDIAAFAGIGDFLEQPVKFYSSGMYARLAFAVAAHVDADILIIDEILAVGDAAFTQKCMRFIEAFKKRGTILFVSHDAGAVARLCERAVWIDSGAVRMIGAAKEVLEHYAAAIYAEADGESLKVGGRRARALPPPETAVAAVKPAPESRVQVFDFDPDAEWFGQGGARITGAVLETADGGAATLAGGEEITLTIEAVLNKDILQPIIGFLVKDRLGQIIFGDNTFVTHPLLGRAGQPGETLRARFRFAMPHLADGQYAISVAIAEGTVEAHTQHHWLHDAIFFQVVTATHFRGLVSVPMREIDLDLV